MTHLSSNIPLGKNFNGSGAEFKAQSSVLVLDIPLSNGSTLNFEEGTTDPVNMEGDNIPRADGGRDAWFFLAACFVFEALIWGFPFAFGVFQTYYSTHPPFDKHTNSIAITGTCATGVMYLFAPVSLYVLETFPPIRRLSSIVGLVIVSIALITASFATQIWHLVVTQGVLYAIGGSLLYSPTMFYLDQWFERTPKPLTLSAATYCTYTSHPYPRASTIKTSTTTTESSGIPSSSPALSSTFDRERERGLSPFDFETPVHKDKEPEAPKPALPRTTKSHRSQGERRQGKSS
ncbi:hypothetical protein DSL72_007448 [Monilinia vaccinii-corymbosi]|uniref:Major facilitator superfamily (MFS) profile domain-containing protein n=1 Tax=Monilinia vaccinii-corymbosi TaxID=61207 RepID=A0A8A3PLM2_9HELO|nr:hypothetical protein DSL72_007448 [Monilinia vaccinii-corymbosi]